jgi:hypothetical protein
VESCVCRLLYQKSMSDGRTTQHKNFFCGAVTCHMVYSVGRHLTRASTSLAGSVENGLLSTNQMREVCHHTVVRLRGTCSTQISTEKKKGAYTVHHPKIADSATKWVTLTTRITSGPPPLHVEYPVTTGLVLFHCSGEALQKMLGPDDVLLQGVIVIRRLGAEVQ